MIRLAAIVAALVLVGCARPMVVVRHVRPAIVVKPRIEEAWLRDCPPGAAREESFEEAKRLAISRRKALEACNADKAKIRKALGY